MRWKISALALAAALAMPAVAQAQGVVRGSEFGGMRAPVTQARWVPLSAVS
jgi:hypothetical protein